MTSTDSLNEFWKHYTAPRRSRDDVVRGLLDLLEFMAGQERVAASEFKSIFERRAADLLGRFASDIAKLDHSDVIAELTSDQPADLP